LRPVVELLYFWATFTVPFIHHGVSVDHEPPPSSSAACAEGGAASAKKRVRVRSLRVKGASIERVGRIGHPAD
jgi:hypothetical protein